jgi:hypothetical protein
MILVYARDKAAAFYGASFFAITPSLVLFLPVSDQVYAAISCVLLAMWGLALQKRTLAPAILFGLTLAIALFASPLFLSLGVFLGLYTLLYAIQSQANLRVAIRQVIVAMGILTAFYFLLWAATRFDPIRTYTTISRMHARDLTPLGRPYPQHIFFDLLDFALGSAWISFVLVAMYVGRVGRKIFDAEPQHRLVLLALVQILAISLPGLLPGESARLWLYLMPLLMAPVGLELARWSFAGRFTVYVCVLAITMIIGQNMIFLDAGPAIDGPISTQPRLSRSAP